MKSRIEDRAVALAGMLQAAWCVQQAARRGLRSGEAVDGSLRSLFVTDPQDTRDVFAGGDGVEQGVTLLKQQLGGGRATHDMELTRYVISLMHLERRLAKRPDMLKTLGSGIRDIVGESSPATADLTDCVPRLADLYVQTLSTLTPRILVNGDPDHLANPATAQLIRALLLAGIRAAVLWRQCGGNRWRLLIERNRMLRAL